VFETVAVTKNTATVLQPGKKIYPGLPPWIKKKYRFCFSAFILLL